MLEMTRNETDKVSLFDNIVTPSDSDITITDEMEMKPKTQESNEYKSGRKRLSRKKPAIKKVSEKPGIRAKEKTNFAFTKVLNGFAVLLIRNFAIIMGSPENPRNTVAQKLYNPVKRDKSLIFSRYISSISFSAFITRKASADSSRPSSMTVRYPAATSRPE